MATNFEKIKACIDAETISIEDKKAMLDIFADVADNYLEDIAALLEKDASWIKKFNDNRIAKHQALTTHNMELWNQIISQEKKYLEDLTYGLD